MKLTDFEVDRLACLMMKGEKVSLEQHGGVVSFIRERIENGEQGDDLPLLMEALGCDYDAACDAIFSGDKRVALTLLKEAADKGAARVVQP